jgi:hypothetical protein
MQGVQKMKKLRDNALDSMRKGAAAAKEFFCGPEIGIKPKIETIKEYLEKDGHVMVPVSDFNDMRKTSRNKDIAIAVLAISSVIIMLKSCSDPKMDPRAWQSTRWFQQEAMQLKKENEALRFQVAISSAEVRRQQSIAEGAQYNYTYQKALAESRTRKKRGFFAKLFGIGR